MPAAKCITNRLDMKLSLISEFLFKKMIPIKTGLYSEVNLTPSKNDSTEERKYKVLLNIEYSFCLKIMPSIIQKASKLYEKQRKS